MKTTEENERTEGPGTGYRILSAVRTIFVYLFAAGSIIAALFFAASKSPTKSIFGYRYYTVLTPSMEPAYHVGEMVFVKIEKADKINVGDVITFNPSSDSEAYLTHRVTAKLDDYKGTTYYKTLSTEKTDDPNDTNHPSEFDEESNQPARFSEVQSVQAGGELVYAPANAGYHWTLEQATEMKTFSGDSDSTGTEQTLTKDTVVGTYNSTAATKITPKDTNYYGAIDASTFTPETTGLYIFRRNLTEGSNATTAPKYEYSGYYFDAGKGDGVYFALHTGTGVNGHSDNVLPAGVINDSTTAVPTHSQIAPVTIADHVYGSIEDISDFDIIVYSETVQTTEIDDSGTVYTDNRWEDAWESFLKIPAS